MFAKPASWLQPNPQINIHQNQSADYLKTLFACLFETTYFSLPTE